MEIVCQPMVYNDQQDVIGPQRKKWHFHRGPETEQGVFLYNLLVYSQLSSHVLGGSRTSGWSHFEFFAGPRPSYIIIPDCIEIHPYQM